MIFVYGAVAFLLALLAAAGTAGVRSLWTHSTSLWDEPFEWWPWGEALWRGWVRSMPSALVATWSGVLALSAGLIAVAVRGDEARAKSLEPIAVASLIFFAIFIVSLLAAASAVLLGRPKALIPPHMRSEQGALQESILISRVGRRRPSRERQ